MKLSKLNYQKFVLGSCVIAILAAAMMLYFAIFANASAVEDQAENTEAYVPVELTEDAVSAEEAVVYEETITTEEAVPADEATPAIEPANDNVKLYFDFKGDCPAPRIKIRNIGTTQEREYVIGEPFVVKNGTFLHYASGFPSLNIVNDEAEYYVNFESPIGYDFADFDPHLDPETILAQDTTITATYNKYDGKYSIETYVAKSGIDPIRDVNVCMYDYDFNPSSEVVKTGEDGMAIIEGIEAENAEGYLMIWLDGYTNYSFNITSKDYNQYSHTSLQACTLDYEENTHLNIQGKNEGHKCFDLRMKTILDDDPVVVLRETNSKWSSIITNEDEALWFGDFKLKENGVIEVKFNLEDNYWFIQEIVPCPQDGYRLDYWMIGDGTGAMTKYTPGVDSSFHIDQENVLIAEAYYTNTPSPDPDPDPDPDPTPVEEEVATAAQTGDSTAALPLAILATACAVVLIANRKRA